MNLTLITDPTTIEEPLTLAEAKSFLRVEGDDENGDISALIRAAREQAELHNGREMAVKQYDLALDDFPRDARYIDLLDPLVSVESITFKDSTGAETTLTADVDYIVDTAKHPGRVVLAHDKVWPTIAPYPSSAVKIRFTAGFVPAKVPESIKTGMKLLITAWYEGRIPFEIGHVVGELPFAVTACFATDRLDRF